MLSIWKLGRGQERYYLDKVAAGVEDYYTGEGEAEGYWLGEGAEILGLEGKVEPDQLGAMFAGEDPATGEPLGLKAAPGREPVPGFDLTFSAPKSVSLTWALGGHPVSGQVAEAHRAAVAEALSYLERAASGKAGIRSRARSSRSPTRVFVPFRFSPSFGSSWKSIFQNGSTG